MRKPRPNILYLVWKNGGARRRYQVIRRAKSFRVAQDAFEKEAVRLKIFTGWLEIRSYGEDRDVRLDDCFVKDIGEEWRARGLLHLEKWS